MASSTHNLYGGATAAPPPTPSTQPNPLTTSDAADVLSKLLNRLPPTLSLPNRVSPPATCPHVVSFSDNNNHPTLFNNLLSSASRLGYFQLTNHSIPPQLAHSAESDSLSLFNLTRDQKQLHFPKNWPLGFEVDDDDDGNGIGESFCLDSSFSTESSELNLSSLCEFTREMGKLGLKVIDSLSTAVGFKNPFHEDPTRICSLMWISEGSTGSKPVMPSRVYPYLIGLQYQLRCQKSSLLADSGLVTVSPRVDSVLVTVGDIAQVWSNGKLKKVRGRPVASTLGDGKNSSRCITMSLLVTLPVDSTVSPLVHDLAVTGNDEENPAQNSAYEKEERLFNSFAFEDYAWRVYHQQLFFKDPLDRYRI